jgi:tetratricopeptide (TPR) repeat protein
MLAQMLNTPQQVESMLARMRFDLPGAEKMSDEDLLRQVILLLIGDAEGALPPDQREIQELIQRGKELCYQKKYKEAWDILSFAEQRAVAINDDFGKAWAKQYLGRVARDTGNLDYAMELYEQALELAHHRSATELIAIIYDQIGTTYKARGDLEQAQAYFQMALATDPTASYATGNLALIHKLRGNAERAQELTAESQRGYQIAGDSRGEAVTYGVQAEACLANKDYLGASRLALKAYRLALEAQHAEAAENAQKIFYIVCGDLLQAPNSFVQFERILQLDWKPDEWELRQGILLNLFMYCVESKLFKEAAEVAWKYIKLAITHNDIRIVSTLRRRGWFRKRPLQHIHVALKRAHAIQLIQGQPLDIASAKLDWAYCLAAQGKLAPALRLGAAAEAIFETNRRPEETQKAQKLCEEIRSQTWS